MQANLKYIRIWLWIGLIMVLIQVLLGGITRLTDSGLSITEWNLVKGVLPPLTEASWQEAFDKYQTHAEQQYTMLHQDMTLGAFKWIYFWEWFHRLWARSMGLVFVFPLIYFGMKGWIGSALWKRLGWIFFIAALAGIFGWIMVMSGLHNEARTWVSAYKLVIHLSIAGILLGVIYWTILGLGASQVRNEGLRSAHKLAVGLLALFVVQFIFGGLMAGMRAGLVFPYFPLWLKPEMTLNALSYPISKHDLIYYEQAVALKAWVQIIHRILPLGIFWLLWRLYKRTRSYAGVFLRVVVISAVVLFLQYLLGVTTVILSKSGIPIWWGVLHQGMGLICLLVILRMMHRFRYR